MTTVIEFARVDPPVVKFNHVEDLLATDDLFIEYFNDFLALPSFPEPLYFNKETGGFEIINDARQNLSKQIKAAIRSHKRTPKIYKAAKNHNYVDIPLYPIQPSFGPEKVEIDTTISVLTLNKEQGIHWIKDQRLPAFLESDKYIEYRLGKIISQCRLMGENGEFIAMKIDYTPKPSKDAEEETEEEEVDPNKELMKKMFVSLGASTVAQCQSWFNTARSFQSTTVTYTTLSEPQIVSSRPSSSAMLIRPDSGIESPAKGPMFGAAYPRSLSPRLSAYQDEAKELDLSSSGIFTVDMKPTTPRPSDAVCLTTSDIDQQSKQTSVYYANPKYEATDTESGLGDLFGERDEDLVTDRESLPDESKEIQTVLPETKPHVVVKTLDELGGVLAGAILKRSLAEVTGIPEKIFQKYSKLFPNEEFSHVTVEMLDHVSISTPSSRFPSPVRENEDENPIDKKEEKKEESDVDSLLDSEDDYEEQDTFFRKHKLKTHDLTSKKGIENFKKFLQGTKGELYWNLWIDIDRSNLLLQPDEVQIYLAHMRERYHQSGAVFELPRELKISLRLVESSHWTIPKLRSIKDRIAEPLVLYWGPRFLLKQLMCTNPDKYYLYHQQQLLKVKDEVSLDLPAASMLPLRPRTCYPRVEHKIVVTDALASPQFKMDINELKTSPRVGLKRSYNLPGKKKKLSKDLVKTKPKKKPIDFLISPRKVSPAKSDPFSEHSLDRARTPLTRSFTQSPQMSRPHSSASMKSRSPTSEGLDGLPPKLTSRPSTSPLSVLQQSSRSTKTGKLSRPQSTSSAKSVDSKNSDFLSGERMQALLQSLLHEKDSGNFFRKFIEMSENKLWINAFNFWNDLQDYHLMFYGKVIYPYLVEKKARTIYSKYVVIGAPKSIGCSKAVSDQIYKCIDPPYEELFDPAEELSLIVLYEAWIENLNWDVKSYNKVELIEVKRHLETKSKYVLNLQKRGIIKERIHTPEDPMEGYRDPVYDDSLFEKIPEEFQDMTLIRLVRNRIELEYFRQFLVENYASMDLMCWMDIEAWRRISPKDEKKCNQKAREIRLKYLNKKYFFGPNSPAGKAGQDKVMEEAGGWGKILEDRPPSSVLLAVQKYVEQRLTKKWLPLFLVTEEFQERQRPPVNMDEVVDDVMMQKKRRSQAVWKLVESRWVSSSTEILNFRRCLLNPVTCLQFRRYVSLQGDLLENDVLFWFEVQKYKELNHLHSDDSMIMQKINAIINCFIDSAIPPPIQIDITTEMAERILDKKYEKSPYLFREAQLTTFRILLGHWTAFCKFRANLTDEKILTTLERKRQQAKKRELTRLEEAMMKQEYEAEHDPFKTESEEGFEIENDAKKIQFTYSKYLHALDQEDLLNNIDQSIFSSVTDIESAKESLKNELQERKMSIPAKKAAHSDLTFLPQFRKEPAIPASGRHSIPEVRFRKKTHVAHKTQDVKTEEDDKKKKPDDASPVTKLKSKTPHPGSSLTYIDIKGKSSKVRLSRNMPPLVQKRE